MGLKINEKTADYEDKKQEAIALTRSGRWEEALNRIDECLKERPADWDLWNAFGVALMKLGRMNEAEEAFRHGLANRPDNRDFSHNLAFVLLEKGQYEEAMEHALAAIALSPDSPEIRRTVERIRSVLVKEARRIRKGRTESKARKDPEYSRLKALTLRADSYLREEMSNLRQKPKLSVIMIVKDEEQYLRECLESVKDVADEIVIADTGSTDGSMRIAKEYGAVCIEIPWNEDFSEARNASLAKATGNWALWIDADERLDKGQKELVRSLIAHAADNTGGFTVNIRNYIGNRNNPDAFWHRAVRLFRITPETRFIGRVHEQVMPSLHTLGYQFVMSHLNLSHYGYLDDLMEGRNKYERFIRMLHRDVDDENLAGLRGFNMFNLGNAYFASKQYEEAIYWLEKAAEGLSFKEEYVITLYSTWIASLHSLHRFDEMIAVADRAEKLGIKSSTLDFERAHAYLQKGMLDMAERHFKLARERGKTSPSGFVQIGDSAASGYKCLFGLALVSHARKDWKSTERYARESIEERPTFEDGLFFLADALMNQNRDEEAIPYLQSLMEVAPEHEEGLVRLGVLLYDKGEYLDAYPHLLRAYKGEKGLSRVVARFADCADRLAQYDEALAAYRKAVEMDPTSADLKINLGRVLDKMGEKDAALKCFSQAILANPQCANAYFNAADLLYQGGLYVQSARFLGEGLKRDPGNAGGFLVLGNCFFQLKQYQNACQAWRRVLALMPNHREALNNIDLAEEILATQSQAA